MASLRLLDRIYISIPTFQTSRLNIVVVLSDMCYKNVVQIVSILLLCTKNRKISLEFTVSTNVNNNWLRFLRTVNDMRVCSSS
jgi:hypothetical protein